MPSPKSFTTSNLARRFSESRRLVGHDEMQRIALEVMEDAAQFPAEAVRDQLRKRGLLKDNIIR